MRNTNMRTAIKALLTTSVAASAILAAQPVLAQDAPAPAADEATEDKEIVIIGTRRTDRSVTDSASPIDVIGATELGAQPTANMLDTIRNLVPSFFSSQNTIADASSFVRPPSLRGLGADQILVMINGKRYNRAALVNVYTGADTALSFGAQGADLANIPSIAVKNLQILRDGATAQYGSDAIAGVINYQIRDNQGLELQGLYGETYRGDGTRRIISGNGGIKLGDRGFINVSGEYFKEGQTSRGATRPAADLIASTRPDLAPRIPGAAKGEPAQIWGSSPTDGWKLFANAAVDVGDESQLYFTGNLASSKSNGSFNYRPSLRFTGILSDNGSGTPTNGGALNPNPSFNDIFLTRCPTGNATCPAGGFVVDNNRFNFRSIYPGGFTPRFIGKVDQAYGTVGLKGKTDSDFTYDLSATFARNSLDLSMTDSLSASYGPQSQTSFEFGKLIQREQVLNLDVTYPLEVGFASPITLSGGAEYRREEYEKTVGDLQSYGAGPFASQPLFTLVTPGGEGPAVYAPTSVTRVNNTTTGTATQSPAASGYGGVSPQFAGTSSQRSYGFYIGAEADVTEKLTMGLAGRFENYNTFGSAVVGKANALYRVTDAVSLRATVGTGFHAPSPGQNNTQVVTTNFRSGNQVQTGTYPVTSSIARYYGSDSLNPERSTNFGAGIVLKPANALTVTIDGYIIKVRNRIGISQTFTVIAADLIALPELATVGLAGDVNYFTNGFDAHTKGVDFIANYRTDLAGGPLNLTFAYNYNKSEAKNIKLTTTGAQLISLAQQSNIKNLAPKSRIVASAGWQIGDFGINARANYYSSWSNELEYAGQRFGAKTTADLDLSYTLAEHYTLTVGANNIFNTYPDKIAASPSNRVFPLTGSLADGQIYPRSGGPFGMNGGFYYVRLRVKY